MGSLPGDSSAVDLLVAEGSSVEGTIAPGDSAAAYSVVDKVVEEVLVLAVGRLVAAVAVVAADRLALAVRMVVAQIAPRGEKARSLAVVPKESLLMLPDRL